MDEWIVADPGVLDGKPCIKGTRLSFEHVLEGRLGRVSGGAAAHLSATEPRRAGRRVPACSRFPEA